MFWLIPTKICKKFNNYRGQVFLTPCISKIHLKSWPVGGGGVYIINIVGERDISTIIFQSSNNGNMLNIQGI